MKKFFRAGGASAFFATLFLTVGGSTEALAEVRSQLPVVQATVQTATPAAQWGPQVGAVLTAPAQPIPATNSVALRPAVAAAGVRPAIATPSLPLDSLVAAYSVGKPLNAEQDCLATAVYFESKGESLKGQLAVAQVVMNRAASGKYPSTWCAVVKQKAQFSFVRAGVFPRIDQNDLCWKKAQAIARIATNRLASTLASDVLWYHADYVAPSWGKRLSKVDKIGAHIFYRA